MKKVYRVLLGILLIEFGILFVLNKMNVVVQSFIGKSIGAIICLLPLLILLFLLGHDSELSKKKRVLSIIAFWYITFVYLLATVVLIATGNY